LSKQTLRVTRYNTFNMLVRYASRCQHLETQVGPACGFTVTTGHGHEDGQTQRHN
jgi:hypothetical protein